MTSSPPSNASSIPLVEVDALSNAMNALAQCGTELAGCMREKQQILVRNTLDSLEAAVEREARLAARFQELERERMAAQSGLSEQLGLEASSTTLSNMLAALSHFDDGSAEGPVATLHAACFGLADQLALLAQLNTDNAHLASNTLEYTRMLLGALSQGGAQPAYGSDGRVTSAQSQELMSIRA